MEREGGREGGREGSREVVCELREKNGASCTTRLARSRSPITSQLQFDMSNRGTHTQCELGLL